MVMFFEMSRIYRDIMEEVGRILKSENDLDLKFIHEFKVRWSHHLTDRVERQDYAIEEAPEESPSGSSSDEEIQGKNTKNFMICLYDKVTKNKLKFRTQFRQGFINIGHEDYAFATGTGDLDW